MLSCNISHVATLTFCWIFSDKKVWTSQLSILLGQVEVAGLENKLLSLNLTGLEEFRLSLNMFIGEEEERVTEAVRRVGEEREEGGVVRSGVSGNWTEDRREFVLLSLVMLFSPDLLNLHNRQEVEELQLSFTTKLQLYLQSKYDVRPTILSV